LNLLQGSRFLASRAVVGHNLQKGATSVKREYSVLYQPIEDGWIMATVPELPGAVTQGRSLEEARTMIKEAVELLLQSYRENAPKIQKMPAVFWF